MRVIKLAGLAFVTLALAACTTITPQSTPISTLSGTSLEPTLATSALPLVSLPPESAGASELPAETATPTDASTPKPERTPKPTKQPTPMPSPTNAGIPGDIEVSFEQSSIPDPWYYNTDYTIRVYISALGTQDLPNVHVTMVAENEEFSIEFDTGPIAITDGYYHDAEQVNLPAIGPSVLTLTGTMPDGYVDTNDTNNTKTVEISVSFGP